MNKRDAEYLKAPLIKGTITDFFPSPVSNPGEVRNLFVVIRDYVGRKEMWRLDIVALGKQAVDESTEAEVIYAGLSDLKENRARLVIPKEMAARLARQCLELHKEARSSDAQSTG